MLLNQLWAALEEKLEAKSMMQESRTSLDKVKGKKMPFSEWVVIP